MFAMSCSRPTTNGATIERSASVPASRYYSLFAMVPFLALTAALAEQLFGLAGVEQYLIDRVQQLGVAEAETAGASIAAELERRSTQSTLGLVGLGSLLFASSLVFLALVDAVNTIWHVPVRSGIRNSVRRRLTAFLMVLATGFVLIAGLAISAISGAIERIIPGGVEIVGVVTTLIGALASASSLVVVLALLFRYIGPHRVPWMAAILTALVTTGLMAIGTEAIGWYLRTFGGSSLSGAFGAVLLALSWVYYEAQIVLAGIQLVKVLTWRSGHGLDPGSTTGRLDHEQTRRVGPAGGRDTPV